MPTGTEASGTEKTISSVLRMGIILLLLMVSPVLGDQDAKRLYEDLLTDYNRLIRPVGNNSDRLTVKLGLKLSQLIDVVNNIEDIVNCTFFIISMHQCSIAFSLIILASL